MAKSYASCKRRGKDIAEVKAEEEEAEEVVERKRLNLKRKTEAGYDDKEEEMAEAKKPIKKTVESIVKETFFAEIENLEKRECGDLKAKVQLAKL